METYVVALDQGTTTSRAISFNQAGEIVSVLNIRSVRSTPSPAG